MPGGLKAIIDIGLQGQISRLVRLAESYKQRVTDQIKQQAISVAVTIALVMTGLAFLLIALVIGFAALYYWVALWHGTLAGLGAAGGSAIVLALLLFGIAASRASGSSAKPDPAMSKIKADARDAVSKTRASLADVGATAERRVAALGKESLDAATGVVRNGSRGAILATLAATVVVGLVLGRRG